MKLKNALRKYRALPVATGLMSVAMCVPAFAADSSGSVTAADWAPVITNLTAQISEETTKAYHRYKSGLWPSCKTVSGADSQRSIVCKLL